MNPETIARLKVGNFGNGKSRAGALHADLNFGANQVEGGVIGAGGRNVEQVRQQKK